MIRLNCEALTHITSICLPYMKPGSHIIHLASAAAFSPLPEFAVYSGSKAYVLSFSKALRGELKKRKINVTAVCPGHVDTPFFDRSERFVHKLGPVKKFVMNTPRNVARKAICDAGFKLRVSFDTPLFAITSILSKFFM